MGLTKLENNVFIQIITHNYIKLLIEFTLDSFHHTYSESNNCFETWSFMDTNSLSKCRIWEKTSLLYLKSWVPRLSSKEIYGQYDHHDDK